MSELIAAIKSKKGLESLDDDFVQQKVEKIFRSNNLIKKKYDSSKSFAQFSRSKEYEELLKQVRKELRTVYGMYQKEGDREEILKRLRSTDERLELVNQLLNSHTSTKERLPYYNQIYRKICTTIKPKSIIDLGCGLNPLAYNYLIDNGCKPTIIASDISQNDMDFLNEAFKVLGIPGKTKRLDLVNEYEELKKLKGNVAFLFKLLDPLEEAKRHISYNIIDSIKTDWIVVSFATKSLGGKKNISVKGRSWFERLLKRKELPWETFSVENELFYTIKNKP